MPANAEREALRERVRREVPETAGVYTWYGEGGEAIYVGKSVNLRRRMLSYLVPGRTSPHSRTRHLAFAVRDFRYRETAGELLALLLEDALIKQLQPRHNERSRDFRERRYLVLHEGREPAFTIVEDQDQVDGIVFGPFKDRYFVRELMSLADEISGVEAVGPISRGPADWEPVKAFLAGDEDEAVSRLSAALDEAAERLAFERAAVLRDRIAFCRRFAARQRFLCAFAAGPLVVDEPGFGLTYRFERGTLAGLRIDDSTPSVPPELRAPLTDRRFLADRGNIVYETVAGRRATCDPYNPES